MIIAWNMSLYLRFTQSSCPFTVGRVLDDYRTRAAERADLGIPPPVLSAPEVAEIVAGLDAGDTGKSPTSSSCSPTTGCPPASTMPPGSEGGLSGCGGPRGEGDRIAQPGSGPSSSSAPCWVDTACPSWSSCSTADNSASGAAGALGHTLLVFDAFHDVVGMAADGEPERPIGPRLVGSRRLVHRPPGGSRRRASDCVQGRR